MRRILTFSMISVIAALASACGSATPAPTDSTAKAETTCEQPAAPPKEGETPTCSGGCNWVDGKCRQERGLGIPQKPDATPGNGPHGGGPPVAK